MNGGSKTLGIVLGVALLLVLGGFAVWFFAVDQPPRRAIGRAADEIARWPSVTYRGTVTESPYGDSRLEVTVDGAGNAYGTVLRREGRAEFARVGPDVLIKADRAWWRQTNPDDAYRLAGVWLKNPGGQFGGIPGLLSSPGALADKLRAAGSWRPDKDRAYHSPAGDRVVIWADNSPVRSLSYTPAAGPGIKVTWDVTAAVPAAADAVREVRSTGLPEYWSELLKRTELELILPDRQVRCDGAGCHVQVRLTNRGTLDWFGEVRSWVNSVALPGKPATCPAGQTVDLTLDWPAGRSNIDQSWYFSAVRYY